MLRTSALIKGSLNNTTTAQESFLFGKKKKLKEPEARGISVKEYDRLMGRMTR